VLNYSLAIHAYSPKLDMFRHVLDNHIRHVQADMDALLACSDVVFVVRASRFSCGFTESLLTTSASSSASSHQSSYDEQFPFDHVYPSSSAADDDSSVPVVILYADLCSPAFKNTHKILSSKADSGDILYMVRPKVSTRSASAPPLSLQGFGAMLAIKNMEYKVLDDSKIEYTDPIVSPDAIHMLDDIETDVNGFLFGTLLARRPDLATDLEQFRDFLLSATKEDVKNPHAHTHAHLHFCAPTDSNSHTHTHQVNVWDMKDLGFQASQRILSAPDPLRMLREISQNFPLYARSLSRVKKNKTVEGWVKGNNEVSVLCVCV